jgi:phage N-6-adenine-methyltransferase
MNPVHFSSATDEWATPQDFFDRLHARWRFTLDVCATGHNTKVPVFYTREENALVQPWFGTCWMNPPYGRGIGKWVEKACRSALEGDATVVCLLPARTDTRWWHEYVIPFAADVRFIRGRLKFGGHKNAAPFPSAVVVFKRVLAHAQLALFAGGAK